MAFEKPKFFYNNTLRDALTGNDGTAYATCAEAIADPDDPNKVRGDIRPAADIPNLADLEGSGIVFDTTKNEYRITDSQMLMQRLSASVLLSAELEPIDMIIEGSFLYTIHYTAPAVIVKFSLPSFARTGQLVLSSGENYATKIIKFGADFFIACRNTSNIAVLVRVNISAFTRTSALTMNSGESFPGALIAYGDDIFMSCRNGTNVGVLVRTQGGATRISALTLNAGELDPTALVVYGTDIFVACYNGTNVGVIVRTAGGISRTSALTLNAGELAPAAMVVYGTDIFVACYNGTNVGVIVRTAGGTSRTSALTLNAGELFPTALIVYGTDIFVTCWTTPSILVRTAGGITRTSALTLSNRLVKAGVLSGSDIYVAGQVSGTSVISLVKTASGTSETSALSGSGGELNPSALLIYNAALFVLCANSASIGTLVQVNLDTLARVSALVLNSGELSPTAMVAYGADIFIACINGSNVGVIVRTAGGLTRTSALTLNAGENYPTAMVLYGTDIFVACKDGSDTAVLVRTNAGLSRTSALTLTAVSETYPAALLVYGTDLFVACRNGSNVATIVRTSGGLTRTSVLALNAGELYPVAMVLSGTDIFVLCRDGSNIAVLVRTAGGLTRTSALTLNAGETYPAAAASLSPYIYILCRNGSNVTVMVKVRDGVTRMEALTLNATELYGSALLLYSNRFFALSKDSSNVGSVQSLDPLPNFSLFLSLQSADIGDSFTVRAGLTCAQADPARPVDYAADGRLAPRFRGTLNTEHKVRIHAPNYLEDGGFESGAFSPSWAAGTDWSINSSSPMEGKYDARHALGTSSELVQSRTNKIEAGKTYRVVFKTKTVTAAGTAGLLTITPRLAGAGASLDSTIAGNAPLITTTAQWYAFDFTPAVSSDRWELAASVDVTKKGSATVLALDELYVYEKRFITSLIVDRHNWAGRGPVTVKNFWCSPFRSTAQAREQESFSRASVAYKSDGTQVSSGLPRYESGNFGSAIMVEEGTTNLLTENQASVETDTTGYGSVSGATLTKDTIEHWHGGASLKIVTPGSVNQEGAISTFVSGLTVSVNYSASVWLKGSGTVSLLIGEYTAADAAVGYTNSSPLVLSSAWQRISVTRLFGGTGVKAKIFFLTSDIQAVTFYADGAQLEQKDYPTSWQLPGAARANEGCSFNPEGIVSPAEGTWAQWVNVNDVIKRQITSDFPRVFTLQRSGGSTGLAVTHADSAANWRLYSSDDAGNFTDAFVSDSYTPNGWHQFVVAWTTTTLKIYIDGILRATISNPKLPRAFTTANIGSGNALYWSNTLHDDIRIWNRALADAEIAVDAARTSPAEISPGCTAAFSFDATLDSGYSFSPADSRVVLQPLPTSDLPCVEIILPAISGWTPEIGDLYLGDFWQMPRYPKPMDPYATDEGGLREFELNFSQIPPQYRTAEIESLFERLRENEGIYLKWDTDPPLLVEDDKRTCKASYDPYRIDLPLKFTERL